MTTSPDVENNGLWFPDWIPAGPPFTKPMGVMRSSGQLSGVALKSSLKTQAWASYPRSVNPGLCGQLCMCVACMFSLQWVSIISTTFSTRPLNCIHLVRLCVQHKPGLGLSAGSGGPDRAQMDAVHVAWV